MVGMAVGHRVGSVCGDGLLDREAVNRVTGVADDVDKNARSDQSHRRLC